VLEIGVKDLMPQVKALGEALDQGPILVEEKLPPARFPQFGLHPFPQAQGFCVVIGVARHVYCLLFEPVGWA
jgi:hypothetical protein